MKISIVTLFPKMISGFFEESIVKRAQEKKLVDVALVDLRKFAVDDYGSVDDRPYGGGVGMVLRVDVIYKALQSLKTGSSQSKIVLTSPKGNLFTQKKAQEYAKFNHLVILAGHYEEVDERVRDYIDEEVSLGDFVLTGGEIVASVITDAVVRLIPGVLEKEKATQTESFFEVAIDELIEMIGEDETLKTLKEKGRKTLTLLEYPHYTRPEEFMGKKVPEILLSGNHKEIEKWRLKKAYEATFKKRQDFLK
ncbi:tRNA (guanosine(37)-N1)-methyltransferase TrmD [Candidatus Roizmanbacteria bacterium]|nr:tRNA (guanosine(37)-N1)-methyltransferase TrmD [Candidatus Roizmanbacteria bacterium]